MRAILQLGAAKSAAAWTPQYAARGRKEPNYTSGPPDPPPSHSRSGGTMADDPAAELIHYLESTPGAMEEFLEGHAANNPWPWQKAWWWCFGWVVLLRTALFRERS